MFWEVFFANAVTRAVALGFALWVAGGVLARMADRMLAAACGFLLAAALGHLIPEAFESICLGKSLGAVSSTWTRLTPDFFKARAASKPNKPPPMTAALSVYFKIRFLSFSLSPKVLRAKRESELGLSGEGIPGVKDDAPVARIKAS